MRFHRLQALLIPLLSIVATLACAQAHHTHTQEAHAPTQRDPAYMAKRQPAMELFDQGKRLEALPLLEELVKINTRDEEVMVALAASLVHHATTLTDQQAAGKERLRAKELLEQSGSVSPLAQNLLQLLRAMPAGGDIPFSENPEVEQAMRNGEVAFSQHNFDQAIQFYSAALKLEPKNYFAALFIANAHDRKNDFAKAAELYQSAIRLDPDIETAYRYYAHMLVREGDMAKARTMLIGAVVAEPYNRMVWRDLGAWSKINHTALDLTYADIPQPEPDSKKDALSLDAKLNLIYAGAFPNLEAKPKNVSDAWKAYRSVHEEWKEGGKFKEHFPQEANYRRSLAEEVEALTAVINVLEKLRRDIDTAEQVTEDQSLLLLLKLHQAGILEPYVLIRMGDEGISKDYAAYRAKNRAKLEEYLDKFVVPAAPANVLFLRPRKVKYQYSALRRCFCESRSADKASVVIKTSSRSNCFFGEDEFFRHYYQGNS